jgi:hypothetical protein
LDACEQLDPVVRATPAGKREIFGSDWIREKGQLKVRIGEEQIENRLAKHAKGVTRIIENNPPTTDAAALVVAA